MKIAEIERLISGLDASALRAIERELFPDYWSPFPDRPQSDAYHSKADYLYYGGAAGGGKTDLLIGLALTQHHRSIIYRREYTQLRQIEDRVIELLDDAGVIYSYNNTKKVFRLPDGRTLELGAVQHAKDIKRWQGRPHDYIGFDEATNFTAHMVKFLCGWLRTDRVGQRCRVVCASNPPEDVDGRWVIQYWAPWLDPKHPDPADPGELRWYVVTGKGSERPVNGPESIEIDGELLTPKSRTFIPAFVQDNPIYMQTGYLSQLQAYEEPLRSIYLMGDFRVSIQDDPWQAIPTAWVEAAMDRWKVTERPPVPCTSIGVDVARGGQDKTVIVLRWQNWIAEIKAHPGRETPTGQAVVSLLLPFLEDHRTSVCVDAIGIGSSVIDHLRDQEALNGEHLTVAALNGAEKSTARDKSGKFGFVNKRAEWYWKLREALDPKSEQDICLPPDRELLQELTQPKFSIQSNGIKIEPKDDIKMRLGRSPDKADAVAYAFVVAEYDPQMYFALEELESYSSPWQL